MGNKAIFTRLLICIAVFGFFLYSYIDKQNEITRRRLEIPVFAQEIKRLKEANTHLRYEIDLFESPERLMELARLSEYSHLKPPMLKEILTVNEGIALQVVSDEMEEKNPVRPKLKFAIGAKQ